jgi:hypothetical protein
MMVTSEFNSFLLWFEHINGLPAERFSDAQVRVAVRQYVRNNLGLEDALEEELFGDGGYLVWG